MSYDRAKAAGEELLATLQRYDDALADALQSHISDARLPERRNLLARLRIAKRWWSRGYTESAAYLMRGVRHEGRKFFAR